MDYYTDKNVECNTIDSNIVATSMDQVHKTVEYKSRRVLKKLTEGNEKKKVNLD